MEWQAVSERGFLRPFRFRSSRSGVGIPGKKSEEVHRKKRGFRRFLSYYLINLFIKKLIYIINLFIKKPVY